MDAEKWSEIKDMIEEKFEILEERKEDITFPNAKGVEEKHGEREVLVFNGPEGKIKLEFEDKEMITDKKAHYSHQGGSGTTEFIFSPTERSYNINAYQWFEAIGNWEKIQWRY